MKNDFIPFPLGTIRGPYSCGWKNDASGGIQFLVKGENGWIPFIRSNLDESECRKAAEKCAKEILNK